MEPFLDCGRNLTADNWFSDYELCQSLLQRKTTYVGTVRKNLRFVPPVARDTHGRQKGDTVHLFTQDATLCSFWDKGQFPVLLLSTQHGGQPNLVEGKPPIVLFYNSTKSGVDNLDKLVRTYPSKRKCRRWPYSVVMALFDTCIIAAHRLISTEGDSQDSHYMFKKVFFTKKGFP